MSDNISLSSFPSSSKQAIAFLYTQNQDLKGKTPNEIYDIYKKAYDELLEKDKKTVRELNNQMINFL